MTPSVVQETKTKKRQTSPTVKHRFNLTDAGNAHRFALRYEGRVIFTPERGWYRWDDRRWLKCGQVGIQALAKKTAKSIWKEIDRVTDTDQRTAIARHAASSESANRIQGMMTLTQSEDGILRSVSDLDQDEWLFNCGNGTLDLRTGELRAHCPDDLITKASPVDYDPEARCPTFKRFLNDITGSHASLKRYLRGVVGYTLTGSTREDCLFFLFGSGSNGKTTFVEIVRSLLGDGYARATDISNFLRGQHDGPRNEIARLVGSRLVTTAETEQGRFLSEPLVKQLTGGNRISARFLYKEPFEFVPNFKIFIEGNYCPEIEGTDDGIWRRIRLIPFGVMFPEEKRDEDLFDKLKRELPGILRWALQGCIAWQLHGLKTPELVRAATALYRQKRDPVGGFLDGRCERARGVTVSKAKLYAAYSEFCERIEAEELASRIDFGRRVRAWGISETRTSKERIWVGLRLRPGGRRG